MQSAEITLLCSMFNHFVNFVHSYTLLATPILEDCILYILESLKQLQ